MRPEVIPVGEGATDYVDIALSLYRQGRRGRFVIDEVVLVLIGRDIKIVMLVAEYAIFLGSADGFRADFPDAVPETVPAIPGDPLPALPTYYPVYPDELLVPLYDRFRAYVAGQPVHYQETLFQTPILSSHNEYLLWNGVTMQPNRESGNSWLLTRYQLGGYLNPYDMPTFAKFVLYSGGVNLFEYDFSAENFFPARSLAREGIAFRRLKDTEQGEVRERIACSLQDDTSHSGQLYEVAEEEGALWLVPFGLADLPGGGRYPAGLGPGYGETSSTGRHVDWQYDVFTSARAQHYYVVRFCSDTAVARNIAGNSYPYPNDIQLFPGMALSVEKRLKSDLSLVASYNLTPAAVDWTLQGANYPEVFWNMANSQQDGYTTGTAVITRFVPYGSGFVLVDAAGVEYPLLPVIACTQDWLWDSLLGETGRSNYVQGIGQSQSLKRNLFQQAALLWLGAPPEGFDGWQWEGVDAAGLKISEAQAGQVNDTGLGLMRTWGSIIGDSDRVLAQALPFDGDVSIQTVSTTETAKTLECRYFYSGFSAGDLIYIDADGPFAYTVTAGDLTGSDTQKQENIVASLIATFNAQAVNYQATYLIGGFDGVGYYTRFTVTRTTAGALDVNASFALPSRGQSNRQRVLSVRVDGTPVVRLERVQSATDQIFMYDI